MKILFSNEKKIFNEHTDGIPYVSFDMLDRMGIPNLYSTRFISWDEERGRGVEGIRTAIMKSQQGHAGRSAWLFDRNGTCH